MFCVILEQDFEHCSAFHHRMDLSGLVPFTLWGGMCVLAGEGDAQPGPPQCAEVHWCAVQGQEAESPH